MRIRLAVFLTVIFLPLFFALAQTTASLDSIPARMHDMSPNAVRWILS